MTDPAFVPVDKIYTLPDFNPRRHFDENALNDLAQSIARRGVIQPIVVRRAPREGAEYHLVAGERRWRAAQIAGLAEVPATIRDCSLSEAQAIALDENDPRLRKGVSAGEEAIAARRMLDALDGDRKAAAKELGWSPSRLDARLLLLHACKDVLDALARGEIYLGHAERLAGLPEETQRGTLKKIIAEGVTVAQLTERLKTFAIPLTEACFDTAECNGCPHNSQTQVGLFSDPLEGERCQNRECFNSKTQAALEARKAELGEKFNIVVLATEKDDDEVRALVKDGSSGVGPEQYPSCHQCAHFGARIENRLNGKTGRVTESLCFNRKCNDEKVAAYQGSLRKETDCPTKPGTAPASGSGKPTSSKKSPSAELTRGAKAVVSGQVRQAVAGVARENARLRKALVVEALAIQLGLRSNELQSAVESLPKPSKSLLASGVFNLQQAAKSDEKLLDDLIVALSIAIAGAGTLNNQYDSAGFQSEQLQRALSLAGAADVDRAALFEVDSGFLAALPKKAISALLDEIGFKKWYIAAHDEASYKKLLGLKKADLPDAIMEAGFEWKGKLPKLVTAFLKSPK